MGLTPTQESYARLLALALSWGEKQTAETLRTRAVTTLKLYDGLSPKDSAALERYFQTDGALFTIRQARKKVRGHTKVLAAQKEDLQETIDALQGSKKRKANDEEEPS